MSNENKQTDFPEREPIQFWFLRPWTPYGIAGIAALTTITSGFFENWKLAIAVVIVGCGLSSTSWVLRFYYRQLCERDRQRQVHDREKNESLEREYAGKIEAREAVTKGREEHIRNLEQVIISRDRSLSEQDERREKVAQALLRFIQDCRQENDRMRRDFESVKDKPTGMADVLRHGLAHSFLQTALERMIQVYRVLLPTTALWGAVRQYAPTKDAYVTIARSGDYDPARATCTQAMSANRSVAKLIREQYRRDGIGIIITAPDEPAYDKVNGDKFGENLSIMAGPIVRAKKDTQRRIRIEMPMWIALNSSGANAFQESLKHYMGICVEIISELLKDWPEIIKG